MKNFLRIQIGKFEFTLKNKDEQKYVSTPVQPAPQQLLQDKIEPLIKPIIHLYYNKTVKMQCLAICNVLRNDRVTPVWLREQFQDEVEEITEIWSKTITKADGTLDVDIRREQPILCQDYNHYLTIYSTDTNMLRYIRFELEKRLKDIEKIKKMSDMTQDNLANNIQLNMSKKEAEDWAKRLFSDIQKAELPAEYKLF